MSKFYVGQRVRIISSPFQSRIGLTATVVSELFWSINVNRNKAINGHRMNIDGIGEVSEDGRPIAYEPHELEPIDDSRNLSTWESVRALTGYVPGEAVS